MLDFASASFELKVAFTRFVAACLSWVNISISARRVCYISALSRLWVFVLQVLFNLISDHQADAFNPSVLESPNLADHILRRTLDGFAKWDAKYILYIANNGYDLEQTFAFFPLLPFIIRCAAFVLTDWAPFLTFYTSCLVVGFLLNFVLFIGATVSLFQLTRNIFGNEKFAFIAAALFSINPSSIFFSSCYTESLYSFCVFKALSLMHDKNRNDFCHQLKFAFWFVLASSTRSNGTVNCGFIAHYFLSEVVRKLHANQLTVIILVSRLLKATFLCCLVLLPFVLFNWYGYIKFCICSVVFYDLECNKPDWCNEPLPLIYNHVQKDLWGLGLFSYYQLRKLPNFVLASPAVILSLFSAYNYLVERGDEIVYLGVTTSIQTNRKTNYLFSSRNIFPFYIHLLFLVFFALLFMHVEVTTRMVMSSSPVIYWTVASFIVKQQTDTASASLALDILLKLSGLPKHCLFYFLTYFILGVLLHCNFYPWT